MKVVNGVCTSANIFTDDAEPYAITQIQMLCDNEAFRNSKIRVMPDVHPGKVGTIGFTATVMDRVLPNVVGIDIGCGTTLAKLKQKKAEFQKLDKVIREQIPSGFQIRKKPHRFAKEFEFDSLYCSRAINREKAEVSLGTLGGGNHFLELDKDEEGNLYVLIHSGSRHFGQEITEYYLREGQRILKKQGIEIPYEWTYLEGDFKEAYLHDVQKACIFAAWNRKCMLDELAKGMKWKVEEVLDVCHNYAEQTEKTWMIRKGAISAKKGEPVVIPINMKEGVLLGKGLGNKEWNESAPHGSGRILKREEVGNRYTVSQFKTEMKGVYCSCIGKETLDEAPFAYRSLETLEKNLGETVEIEKILLPVYNFKAGSKGK